MKTFLFSLIFLCLSSYLYADFGPAQTYLLEVSYDKGKVTGYVWVGEGYPGNIKDAFSSDALFTSYMKERNSGDSLYVYQEIYRVDSLDIDIFFKDKVVKIDEDKIIRITLKKIILSGFGTWVSSDRFETKDLIWLKKPYVKKELLYDEACDIQIYFFEEPGKDILDTIRRLKNDTSNEYTDRLYDFLKKLEKQKVVVHSVCSC